MSAAQPPHAGPPAQGARSVQPEADVNQGASATSQQALLAGALAVLSVEPRASMQRVAQASGLHRATLYRHFPSREDLVGALVRRAMDEAEVALRAARPADGDVRAALLRVVTALVDVGDRYRVITDQVGRDPALRAREEEVGQPLLDLLERGRRDGTLTPTLPVSWAAEVLVTLLLAALRQAAHGELLTEDLPQLVCSTFLNGASRVGQA